MMGTLRDENHVYHREKYVQLAGMSIQDNFDPSFEGSINISKHWCIKILISFLIECKDIHWSSAWLWLDTLDMTFWLGRRNDDDCQLLL